MGGPRNGKWRRREHTCVGCGAVFIAIPSRTWCSRACRDSKRLIPPRACIQCGAVFKADNKTKQFCGKQCWLDSIHAVPAEVRREHALAVRRAWKEVNKEKLRAQYTTGRWRERSKVWRAANQEKVAASLARYKENNPERVREAKMSYSNSDRGKEIREKHRRKVWSNPPLRMKRIVNAAFVRAIRNDIEFDQCIREMFIDNPPMVCACCGVGFNYNDMPSKERQRTSPSIDRVDNDKGYVVGNVQMICWGCNADKSHLTIEKLERFLSYIKTYAGKMPVTVGAL